MALFDFFKKKLKREEKKVEKKPFPPAKKVVKPKVRPARPAVKKEDRETEKKAEAPKAEKKEAQPVKPKRIIKSKVAWKVLESPHVTEKAAALTEANQYIFRVTPRSNKIEIKQAVEDVYGVNVENVRVINVSRKRRRLGRTRGWKKGYKKAIVKIQKGQEIEILPR